MNQLTLASNVIKLMLEMSSDLSTAYLGRWKESLDGIRQTSTPYTADRAAQDMAKWVRLFADTWDQAFGYWMSAPTLMNPNAVPTVTFIIDAASQAAPAKTVAVAYQGPDVDDADLVVTPLRPLAGGGNDIPADRVTRRFDAGGLLTVGLRRLHVAPAPAAGEYLGAVYYAPTNARPLPLASLHVIRTP